MVETPAVFVESVATADDEVEKPLVLLLWRMKSPILRWEIRLEMEVKVLELRRREKREEGLGFGQSRREGEKDDNEAILRRTNIGALSFII